MILAAADYAEGKGPPPAELELAFLCRQYRCLPRGGGIYDQLAGELERMHLALNVYEAIKDFRSQESKDIGEWIRTHKNNDWKIVKKIKEMRKTSDG